MDTKEPDTKGNVIQMGAWYAAQKQQQQKAPVTPLEYALKYASIGWYVFPVWGGENGKCRCGQECKSPGKHPNQKLSPNGQDGATLDTETITGWWTLDPAAAIGIHLRPSGLVAFDIDPRNGGIETMDQIEVANGPLDADVLAFTQGGGEHRVFSLPENSASHLPGKLGNGVDVKRNGYIVVEPSRGIKGQYVWEASSDPLEGAIPGPLPDWLRDVSYTTRPASQSTVRFATPGQIEELRSALAVIGADDRDTWVRFLHALKPLGQDGFDLWDEWARKSDKYNPVYSAKKWHSAKPTGAINYESIFFEAQALGWSNPMAGGLPPSQPIESISVAAPVAAIPAPDIQLPGILGMVQEWINATSRKPQPLFATQAALAFGAALLGRRYVTTRRNWPSLFLLNIGKSASGKEHAKWALERLIEACGLGSKLIGPDGYTSDSGVLSALHSRPSHLTVMDEFGKLLESASSRQNNRPQSAFRAMMEAFGRADGIMRPMGYSTALLATKDSEALDARIVRNPALTLLGLTTPETFYAAITSTAIRDGFLNRFLIAESDIGRRVGQYAQVADIPAEIASWALRVREYAGLDDPDINATLAPTPTIVGFEHGATSLFDEFDAECIDRMDSLDEAGMAEMFGRSNEIALRVSLILAIGDDCSSIRASHARMAIDYVRQNALRTISRLNVHLADSIIESVRNQVLEIIRKSGHLGCTERDLHKQSRKFRSLDHNAQTSLLRSFSTIGDAQRAEIPTQRGRKRVAWVAVQEEAV